MIKQAIEALEMNNWNQAHEIAQGIENTEAYWLHGILHAIEGDTDNARYWYDRAGRAFSPDTQAELKAIKAKVGLA